MRLVSRWTNTYSYPYDQCNSLHPYRISLVASTLQRRSTLGPSVYDLCAKKVVYILTLVPALVDEAAVEDLAS